jgi:hypothetical protein
MTDKQVMNWAFNELRKRFRTQSKKFYALAEAAIKSNDNHGYDIFLAASQTYKRAVEEVVSIDIRAMIMTEERDAADDRADDMGN